MAEYGAPTACKNSSDPSPFIAQCLMPDCVDTSMNAVETPSGEALCDSTGMDPGG
jgi:hypothetical protein